MPLTNLDTLMEGTYRHVLETTELIEECQMELARSSNNLSCITSILIFLMHLTASMTYEEISLVQSALSPIVNTTQEQVNDFYKNLDFIRQDFQRKFECPLSIFP